MTSKGSSDFAFRSTVDCLCVASVSDFTTAARKHQHKVDMKRSLALASSHGSAVVELTISSLIEVNNVGYERKPSADVCSSNEVLIQVRCSGSFGRSRALVLIVHARHLQRCALRPCRCDWLMSPAHLLLSDAMLHCRHRSGYGSDLDVTRLAPSFLSPR
jgi:hypothetical protein